MKTELPIANLVRCIQQDRMKLQGFREERLEAVRDYVGKHWGEEGTRLAMPVNLLSTYVSIVGRSLIAKEPRFMNSIFDSSHKPAVATMQDWMNKRIEDINLADTLGRCVTDSLFCLGILKIALATPEDSAHYSWRLKAGEPFVEVIDFDDFVYDTHARRFESASYIAHRFRRPLAVVKEMKYYSERRKDLAATIDQPYNREGDERINVLGRGFIMDAEELEDMIDLWEIWLPRFGKIVTLSDQDVMGLGVDKDVGPLRVQDWIGPDVGPYHFLSLGGYVPGNAVGKGPIQDLVDLNMSINQIYRKSMEQARRQKEVFAVSNAGTEDYRHMTEASDGDGFQCERPDMIKAIAGQGPSQSNVQYGVHLKDTFNSQAGNLSLMGGLAPQSKTATQDKMLNENATGGIADKQAATVAFVARVGKALGWYFWEDPFNTMRAEYSIPGMDGMSVPRELTPQQRSKVKFEDLTIKFDPYSIQQQTPQSRMQMINGVIQQLQPMMPLLAQQNLVLNLNKLLELIARYGDMPDLNELFTMQEPQPDQQAQQGGTPDKVSMPPNTERTYTRRSLGGDTPEARQAMLTNMMPGKQNGQPQNGEQQ